MWKCTASRAHLRPVRPTLRLNFISVSHALSLFPSQERERLKQEKRDEKRLNKERKLELRRLELEMLREMKKPNEDMCLTDHKVNSLTCPGVRTESHTHTHSKS